MSFLPQFVPRGSDTVTFSMLLAVIHAAMGVAWFVLIVLATRSMARVLNQPAVKRTMDGVTGMVMIAFGARLLLERRQA